MLSTQRLPKILALVVSCGLAVGGMTACQTGDEKAEPASEPVSAESKDAEPKAEQAKPDAPGAQPTEEKTEKPAKKAKAPAAKDKKKKKKADHSK